MISSGPVHFSGTVKGTIRMSSENLDLASSTERAPAAQLREKATVSFYLGREGPGVT
jgi:hypothetical protein